MIEKKWKALKEIKIDFTTDEQHKEIFQEIECLRKM